MFKVVIFATILASSFSYADESLIIFSKLNKEMKKYVSAGTYEGEGCSIIVELKKDYTLLSVRADDSDLDVEIVVRNKQEYSMTLDAKTDSLTLLNVMEDGDEANGAYTINESIEMSLTKKDEFEVYAFRSYDYESGQESDFEDVSCKIKR